MAIARTRANALRQSADLGSAPSRGSYDGLIVVLLAVGVALANYLIQGRLLPSFSDEGRLWYASWRTSLGEVPIRDFRSYAPARYYWNAAWFWVLGPSFDTLRMAVCGFQALGLWCGLTALRDAGCRIRSLVWAAILLGAWMFPFNKLFESSIAMAAVLVGGRVLDEASESKWSLRTAGAFLAVAPLFGSNHGLYAFLGLGIVFVVRLFINREPLGFLLPPIIQGCAIGGSALLALCVFAPGFLAAYIDSLVEILELDSTNIPLAIPWLWTLGSESGGAQSARIATSVLYTVWIPAVVAGLVIGLYSLRSNRKVAARLVASAIIARMYMHHATARADIGHLGEAVQPLLLLLLFSALLARGPFVSLLVSLTLTAWTLPLATTGWPLTRANAMGDRLVQLPIGETTFKASQRTQVLVSQVELFAESCMAPGETIFIGPDLPGLYVLLNRKSPTRQLLFQVPLSGPRQSTVIDELEAARPEWLVLGDTGPMAIDGRWLFRTTSPAIWSYLEESYSLDPCAQLPPPFRLMRRNSGDPPQR